MSVCPSCSLKCNKIKCGESTPIFQYLVVHRRNKPKVLDNKRMDKHVKCIKLEPFYPYNKDENFFSKKKKKKTGMRIFFFFFGNLKDENLIEVEWE